MTPDKARDFFSAYHEGSLEPGLQASLERRLREDAGLRAEYDAFAATLDALGALRLEAVEAPAYLNERIAARVDAATLNRRPSFWESLLAPRPLARPYYALGLATAALVAAAGLRGFTGGAGVSRAGVVPLPESAEPVTWNADAGGVLAQFAPVAAPRTVTVTPDGGEAQTFRLAGGQPFDLTLQNPNREARRFRIAQGDETLAVVAVPGSRSVRHPGSGTLNEMASALADAYRTTVVVKGAAAGATVRWSLEGDNAQTAAQKDLEGHGSAVGLFGNVLQIGR